MGLAPVTIQQLVVSEQALIIRDSCEVNEVPIYEKQPPLSWSFAPCLSSHSTAANYIKECRW